jgi:hypothetical protein
MKLFITFLLTVFISVSFALAEDNFDEEFSDPSLQRAEAPNEIPQEETNESFPKSENFQSEVSTDIPLESDPTFEVSTDPVPLPTETVQQSQNPNLEEPGIFSEPAPLMSGEVLVETPDDLSKSYKQRRGRHGLLFSITYEHFYPVDYFSQYRDVYIEKIIGDDRINLVGAEFGYKLNFQLGALSILANMAQGEIKGKVNNSDRTLYLQRVGLSANFAMDNFFEEPWVVPYGQAGVHQFQSQEDDLAYDSSRAATTQYSLNYRLGLLFQLNWIEKSIDPNTQIDGLRSSGLQNTFLDVYASSYLASTDLYDPLNKDSEGDPDLASEFELGVGIKMEF